ncbi:MAG: 50S ribosomal protein L2 [Candidatus ainarchaeum sp.]|nr:50S ribosomal protein L2 [Candidatus ainarchaeum sp.]
MGKRLRHQRRGSGSPKYRSKRTRYKVELKYRGYDDVEKAGMLKGEVVDFLDDPGKEAILMKVRYDNNETNYLIAPEGIAIGDSVETGVQAKVTNGGVLPIYRIPDGSPIFNIERRPGDGGKMVRAPGTYATLVSKEEKTAYIKMPSRQTLKLSNECRAQVGVIAGGGKIEKPLVKAGKAYYKHRAKSKIWPYTRGVAMSPYDHPFGGKQHHEGRPTTVKRGDPPGRKVGHIAARSTGRKKGKKVNVEGEER